MDDLIKQLGLNHLDNESGLYAVENTSAIEITAPDGTSPASSCIYYALTKEHPQNHLHWLMPDDHHILISGGPADYYLFHPDGQVEKQTLGLGSAAGPKADRGVPGWMPEGHTAPLRLGVHARWFSHYSSLES